MKRIKWSLVGYLILTFGVVIALIKVEDLSRKNSITITRDCVDKTGDLAFRKQDQEVIDIYSKLKRGEFTITQAQEAFVKTYENALKLAGPVPECIAVK